MSDSNVYTAERILNKRTSSGVTQYLIKWKGYSQRDSTWEPVENILDRSLLTSFEAKEKKNKRDRRGSARAASNASRSSDLKADSQASIKAEQHSSRHHLSPPSKREKREVKSNAAPALISASVSTNNAAANAASSVTESNSSEADSEERPLIIDEADSKIHVRVQPSLKTQDSATSEQQSHGWQADEEELYETTKNNVDKGSASTSTRAAATSPVVISNKVASSTKAVEIQVDPINDRRVDLESSTLNNNHTSSHTSPMRITSTPLPVNNILVCAQIQNNSNSINNAANNSSPRTNRKVNSRNSILSTVTTDVTVNEMTVTIRESKTSQGFFRETNRSNAAVDASGVGNESRDI